MDIQYFIFFFNLIFYTGVYLIYNIVLVSSIQQSGPVIHIHTWILFQILFPFGHYRILNRIACAVHLVLVCYLFYIYLICSSVYIREGNGNPLQCSCLENPRDGGAWWAAGYGVTQSRPWLKRLSSSSSGGSVYMWIPKSLFIPPLTFPLW